MKKNFKPDKECVDHEDMRFLSEIITNSIYLQSVVGIPSNLRLIFKHIFNFADVQTISIICTLASYGDLPAITKLFA